MSRDQLYSEFHVSVSPDTTSSDSRLPAGILLSANVTSFHFETDEYWFRVDGIFQPYPPSPGEVLPPAQSLVLFRDNTDFYNFHISLLDTFPREAGRQPPHPRMIPYIPGTARDVDDILAITRRSELDDYVKTLCALSNVGAKYILEHQVVRKFLTIKPGDSKKLIPPRVPEMKALFGQGFPTALPHDSMCPHGSPLKPATGVLVYQTSVAFLKAACNPRLPGPWMFI
ncbi:hypothetical protein B0H11DRAFT_497483 [Mycena galericulata]|nr:hypothetical protein B0H11DRAFT_497483 [Mycena galericulata]